MTDKEPDLDDTSGLRLYQIRLPMTNKEPDLNDTAGLRLSNSASYDQ